MLSASPSLIRWACLALVALALVLCAAPPVGDSVTLIVKSADEFHAVVESVRPLRLGLAPENVIAKAVTKGEALQCTLKPEVVQVTFQGESRELKTLRVECKGGAKFRLYGVAAEE